MQFDPAVRSQKSSSLMIEKNMQNNEESNRIPRPVESSQTHLQQCNQRAEFLGALVSAGEPLPQISEFREKLHYESPQRSTATHRLGLSLQSDSSTWLSSQQPSRGSVQVSLNGHPLIQPHLCYGYMPSYNGFMSNPCGEYVTFDPSLYLRRQKPRTVFTTDQLKVLEATFEENNYPSALTRREVAKRVDLPVDRVRVWFQNRRAKEKRLKEDRLALSVLTSKGRGNQALSLTAVSAQPIVRSEQIQKNQAESSSIGMQSSIEAEEALVRCLLREAKAREEARCRETNHSLKGDVLINVTAPASSMSSDITNQAGFAKTKMEERVNEDKINKLHQEASQYLPPFAKIKISFSKD